MKNIIKITLASLFINTMFSCADKPREFSYHIVEQSDSTGVSIDTLNTDVSSVYISYPVFEICPLFCSAYKEINKDIKLTSLGSFSQEKELIDSFFYNRQKTAQLFGKNENPFMPWTYISDTKIILNSSKQVTIQCTEYTYQGGAHGITSVIFNNYSLETGSIILLENIIKDTTYLKTALTKSFVEQYKLNSNLSFQEQGFFIDGTTLPLSEEFAILPEGIVFLYNQYEIAPYSSGQIYVVVKYDDIKDILLYTPDHKNAEVFSLHNEV